MNDEHPPDDPVEREKWAMERFARLALEHMANDEPYTAQEDEMIMGPNPVAALIAYQQHARREARKKRRR